MMKISSGVLTLTDKRLGRTWQRSFVFLDAMQFQQACRDSILDLFREWNSLEAGESEMEMKLEINGTEKPEYQMVLGPRDVLGSKLYKTLAASTTNFINGVYNA